MKKPVIKDVMTYDELYTLAEYLRRLLVIVQFEGKNRIELDEGWKMFERLDLLMKEMQDKGHIMCNPRTNETW